mmetsp:Transcript_23693/g.47106  ORF Transcript_23693/g.47106 Transcript_23693/m.47106 type:complete len:83 (+) Transcript_23693:78-326(+)
MLGSLHPGCVILLTPQIPQSADDGSAITLGNLLWRKFVFKSCSFLFKIVKRLLPEQGMEWRVWGTDGNQESITLCWNSIDIQ